MRNGLNQFFYTYSQLPINNYFKILFIRNIICKYTAIFRYATTKTLFYF